MHVNRSWPPKSRQLSTFRLQEEQATPPDSRARSKGASGRRESQRPREGKMATKSRRAEKLISFLCNERSTTWASMNKHPARPVWNAVAKLANLDAKSPKAKKVCIVGNDFWVCPSVSQYTVDRGASPKSARFFAPRDDQRAEKTGSYRQSV
jgi:hypothetical protein